jgi:putative ABC transport system permease protein
MLSKTPLAWLQLTRERVRLMVALAGISFADILMFMQLGFQGALYDTNTRVPRAVKGDLVLINPQSDFLFAMKAFSRRRLYEMMKIDGVESVSSLYIGQAFLKNPETKKQRTLGVLAFDPYKPAFDIPEINKQLDVIKLPDVYLFDEGSAPTFGAIGKKMHAGETVFTELSDVSQTRVRRIRIGGLFRIGRSFAADGNIVTSDSNYQRLFNSNPDNIQVGLLTVKAGYDAKKVKAEIDKILPKRKQNPTEKCYRGSDAEKDNKNKNNTDCPQDVMILTRQEYADFEKRYWQTSTNIGFIFSLGVAMGFVVGIVIVYQILYTDVADHLPEYATLKAMGYQDIYLLGVVFQEALLLSVLGFLPGLGVSVGLYALVKNSIALPMVMTLERAIMVLFLTVIMCLFSGVLAIQKLQAADPADIF